MDETEVTRFVNTFKTIKTDEQNFRKLLTGKL